MVTCKVSNKKDIANGFNNFFVNVGPNLAKSIVPIKEKELPRNLLHNNEFTMFLADVSENELLRIVSKCKNKSSCDVNGLNMSFAKATFNAIIKPFTQLSNLSLTTAVFPQK